MATTAASMTSPPVSPVAGPSDGIMASMAANLPSAPVELDGSPVTHPDSSFQPSDGSSRSEERAKAHAAKQKDPAVLVDIPKTPTPQDYEVAEKNVNISSK